MTRAPHSPETYRLATELGLRFHDGHIRAEDIDRAVAKLGELSRVAVIRHFRDAGIISADPPPAAPPESGAPRQHKKRIKKPTPVRAALLERFGLPTTHSRLSYYVLAQHCAAMDDATKKATVETLRAAGLMSTGVAAKFGVA